MRLDQELVRRGLCESRTEAQELIEKGYVLLDGVICTKQSKQVTEHLQIQVKSKRQFVSRGGEKLQGVLRDVFGEDENIHLFCASKRALDIGSSTGGFTDCLLSYGVSHADAIDVGSNQMHEKIRNDKRVSVYENTDIRNFRTDMKYDIVVADLSFISLSTVFDRLLEYGKNETYYFLLIKPQFEVGKGNTKKGIVKDRALVTTILKEYEAVSKAKGLMSVAVVPSRLEGGDGNQEYFLYGIHS